jgi:hypothetical protein
MTPVNTKGGRINVPLTSLLTGLESSVWQRTISIFICKTDKPKPLKHGVNGTLILPPIVFHDDTIVWMLQIFMLHLWSWLTILAKKDLRLQFCFYSTGHTVIMIVNYNRKTFIVLATVWLKTLGYLWLIKTVSPWAWHFTAVIYGFEWSARLFVPGKPFQLSLMFVGKAGA